MNELIRSSRERYGGSAAIGTIFDEPEPQPRAVTVSYGPYRERLPVAGMTVREVRARFHDRFDLDPRSQAVVDGREVSDETVVRAGQTLMFTHRAGEKGLDRATTGLASARLAV
jgi:hypothetical protein